MSETVEFKRATVADIETLLPLLREFYAFEHLVFEEVGLRAALRGILENPVHGHIYLIEAGGEWLGYTVLTLGYSLEFRGVDAFVDELYLREAARGRGLGKQALEFLAEVCRTLGIKALHLEVDHSNQRAQSVYQTFGFQNHDRHLMTKWLT